MPAAQPAFFLKGSSRCRIFYTQSDTMLLKKFLSALVAVLYSFIGYAQEQQAVESEIRRLENEVVQAILRSDTARLKQLWAPEFLVNTPRNNVANGRAAVLEIQRAGLIHYNAFERTIEQILVRGQMAITMGSEWYTSSANAAA